MKKLHLAALTIFIFGNLLLLNGCNDSRTTSEKATDKTNDNVAGTENAALSDEELIAKGEHLVVTSGCEDCHSPKKYKNGIPESDMDKRLSGHPAELKLAPYDANTVKNGWAMTNQHFTAWVGPWGTSFSSNITSDSTTGIGGLTEEQFFTILREGKYHGVKDGRMLLPPMPWPNFAKFTDDEIRAIFAFLKSTKPIKKCRTCPNSAQRRLSFSG